MPPDEQPAPSGTPAWFSALGSGAAKVGKTAANVLAIAAGSPVVPFPGPPSTEWQHPERRELALQYIPETLDPGEQFKRLETFRQIPLKEWPTLINHFQDQDRRNAELMQTPQYQAIYQQGGPQALQAFGMPLPPHVLAAQDAPLSAEAQARGETAPSLPFRTPHAVLPPIPPDELVKRFGAETQLDAMRKPGTEGAMARAAVAKVPLGFEDATAAAQQFSHVATKLGYTPEISVDASGVSLKMSRPEQAAFQAGMGQKRSQYTPLGGGTAAPAPSPSGAAPIVVQFDDGSFGMEMNGALSTIDAKTAEDLQRAGLTVQRATKDAAPAGTPAPTETPMRGQASLSIGNNPDATAADLQLLTEQQQNALKLDFEQQKAAMEAKLKGAQLNENERTKLAKIAAARSFLNVFEQYGLRGQQGDPATGAETFASTLPNERISGLPAAGELLRQSAPVQSLARDPFLQGFRRYQSIARPIIARNLGDDTGNLSETEQAAAAAMTAAASKPELRDAVAQMRAIIDEREKALLAGKTGAAPAARPVTPEEARAELRRRGKLP